MIFVCFLLLPNKEIIFLKQEKHCSLYHGVQVVWYIEYLEKVKILHIHIINSQNSIIPLNYVRFDLND